jgi:TonB family protein
MNDRAAAAGLTAALALSGAAAAQPPGLRAPSVVTNPDWIEKPSGEEFANVFPAAAQMLMIPGHVLLGCQVAVSGDLEACHVIEEAPLGEGFGAAAMLLTPRFKMRPMRVNGAAVGGARINIPIVFAVNNATLPSAAADAPVPAEASARAMALAERIVVALGHEDLAPPGIAAYSANLDRVAKAQIGDPEQAQNRDAAAVDLYKAMSARLGRLHQARVRSLARTYTESELGGIADFLESPAGRAFVAKGAEVNQAMAIEAAGIIRDATAEARKAYCASRDCGPALAHAPAAK